MRKNAPRLPRPSAEVWHFAGVALQASKASMSQAAPAPMARSLLLAFVVVATTHAFRATTHASAARTHAFSATTHASTARTHAFSATTHASTARPKTRVAPLSMGLFDAFAAAFKNEDFTRDDVRCRARHVLVPDEARAAAVLAELEGGADFAAVARRESTCASASKGGDLGEFKPGAMVAAFDAACFEGEPPPPAGSLVGPVKTQFGYHVILITDRSMNRDQVTELLARND